MDKLRCPNFPCDYSNCVIMEVGAEWPSADGQKYKAPGFMPPLTVQTDTAVGTMSVFLKGRACSLRHSRSFRG